MLSLWVCDTTYGWRIEFHVAETTFSQAQEFSVGAWTDHCDGVEDPQYGVTELSNNQE